METYPVLKGRKALVTGASGGLGLAVARELAAQGCHLFLTGRDRARLAAAGETLRPVAASVHQWGADLADPKGLEALAGQAEVELKDIDILVNCAGIFPVHPLEQSSMAEYDQCFAINVRAPFYLMHRFAPAMAKRGWGRIVNIGSSSAYAGFKDTSVYCASKHALLGLSRALFNEYKSRGVRVYCLSPGSIQTEMGKLVPGQIYETFMRPDEVARYISFMMSFDAEMISEEVRLNRVIVQ
jgi:NAD(P)-dependent dehydrogenase (short-subunit alcohol dehydrogenase family)